MYIRRTYMYILVIRYYVTTVLFTYPWVIYTIGLENEYLDNWDTGKNRLSALAATRCCSDATRTEVHSIIYNVYCKPKTPLQSNNSLTGPQVPF